MYDSNIWMIQDGNMRHFHMLGKVRKTSSDLKWMIAQINFAFLDVRWFRIVSENLRIISRATSTDRGMPWILCLLAKSNKYMKCICSILILFWPRVQRTTIDKGDKAQRKHCCRLSHSSKFASCASSDQDFQKFSTFAQNSKVARCNYFCSASSASFCEMHEIGFADKSKICEFFLTMIEAK